MEQLELFLLQFLRPDNEARKQAEEQIKRLAKDPLIISALLLHVRSAPSSNVRQLAAVLLRKKIVGHWMKLSPQVRASVKAALLESITVEHRFWFLYLFSLSLCLSLAFYWLLCDSIKFQNRNSEISFNFSLFHHALSTIIWSHFLLLFSGGLASNVCGNNDKLYFFSNNNQKIYCFLIYGSLMFKCHIYGIYLRSR